MEQCYSFFSETKNKYVIDHINSNRLDNRLSNLQAITQRANLSKERTLKSSLPCGVWHQKTKKANTYMRATISILNKRTFLGVFKSKETASQAYQIALSIHNKGKSLNDVYKAVNNFRISIGLKPTKTKHTTSTQNI